MVMVAPEQSFCRSFVTSMLSSCESIVDFEPHAAQCCPPPPLPVELTFSEPLPCTKTRGLSCALADIAIEMTHSSAHFFISPTSPCSVSVLIPSGRCCPGALCGAPLATQSDDRHRSGGDPSLSGLTA